MRLNKFLTAMVLAFMGYSSSGWAQILSIPQLRGQENCPTILDGGSTEFRYQRYDQRDSWGHKFWRQYVSKDREPKGGSWEKWEHFGIHNTHVDINKPYIDFELCHLFRGGDDDWNDGNIVMVSPGGFDKGNADFKRILTTRRADQGAKVRDQGYGGVTQIENDLWGPDNDRHVAKWRYTPSKQLIEDARRWGNKFRLRIVSNWDEDDNNDDNDPDKMKMWGSNHRGDYVVIYTMECTLSDISSVRPTIDILPNGKVRMKTGSLGKGGYTYNYEINTGYRTITSPDISSSGTSGTELNLGTVDISRAFDFNYQLSNYRNESITFGSAKQNFKSGWFAPSGMLIVKSVPVAYNIVATRDVWKRSFDVSWSAPYATTSLVTDGKWLLWRKLPNDKDFVYVGCTRDFNDRKITDELGTRIGYNQNVTYKVAFCPDYSPWTTSASNYVQAPESTFRMDRELTGETDIRVEGTTDAIVINWEYPAIPLRDADQNQTSFQLERSTDQGKTWQTLGQSKTPPSATESTTGNYSDTDVQSIFVSYKYRLKIFALGKTWYSKQVTGTLKNGFKVYGVEASAGTFPGLVKVQWNVKHQGKLDDKFVLLRRSLKSNNEEDWMTIYKVTGQSENYFYDDNTALPGNYYEYKVEGYQRNNENKYVFISDSTSLGFSQATGVISGRVSYGTGTAVKGVRLNLKQDIAENDETGHRQFSSMHIDNVNQSDSKLIWAPSKEKFNELVGANKAMTIQMWLNMDNACKQICLFAFDGTSQSEGFDLGFLYKEDLGSYILSEKKGNEYIRNVGCTINKNEWVHVTWTHNGKAGYRPALYIRTSSGTFIRPAQQDARWNDWNVSNINQIVFGLSKFRSPNFVGNFDDIRIWNKYMTAEEDSLNYDCILSGSEPGLKLYWPLDEGLNNYAFDVSKTDGVPNGNHALQINNCQSSDNVPDKLGLYGITDVAGNYIIRGVPFTGEGVNYSITPTMGVHKFAPHHLTRYVSANELNHSAVDFEDQSSFVVRGRVRYANTEYPVEGVNLYVDGQISSKNGEIITTNSMGEYEISVPIGDHYISVGKQDHVFSFDGNYPSDAKLGGRYTFVEEMNEVNFWDETLVTVTGRVVGGDVEGSKPLGFGKSKNNIGRASIDLETVAPYSLNMLYETQGNVITSKVNPNEMVINNDHAYINSSAVRGGGEGKCNHIYIKTDSLTGEFVAKVPPITYIIRGVTIEKSGETLVSDIALNASNPSLTASDSIETENGMEKFTWNVDYRLTHHVDPTLSVVQEGQPEGAYGVEKYIYKEYDSTAENGVKETPVTLFTKGENNAVTYTQGHPIFICKDPYTFHLRGYEKFVNADNQEVDEVPLAGTVVTISNALSASQQVFLGYADGYSGDLKPGQVVELNENQCQLDSLGQFTYQWQAGLPNVTAPFTRTLGISYDVGGKIYQWKEQPLEAIIFGDLTTGSNFVTAGPERLDYVLRDPCGTGSFSTWQKGVCVSTTERHGSAMVSDNNMTTVSSLGASIKVVTGSAGMGVLMGSILESETRSDVLAGLSMNVESDFSNEKTVVTTTTQDVSTQSTNDYVGDGGDVFIGTGTNILFGKARQVGFHRDEAGQLQLGVKDATSFGSQFTTQFFYSQNYVKNYLLPNWKNLRAEKLQTKTRDFIASYRNTGKDLVYLTELKPEDPQFGQPGTYEVFAPEEKVNGNEEFFFTDSIYWVNLMIENWEGYLADNERQKVEVFKARDKWLKANHSFDVGSTITNSVTTEFTEKKIRNWKFGGSIIAGYGTKTEVGAVGVTVDVSSETGVYYEGGSENSETQITANSYTLAEEGERDALTVDVYEAPDGFGPIFRTRGGQTSVPYEGEVVTEYYQPGTIIMEATMQIEKPTIGVTQAVVSDVPSGRPANFTLQIRNESETAEDLIYKLFVWDATNPNGARITVDGEELGKDRLMKVPYGTTMTKSLQIWQTNRSVYDYENIELVIGSVEDKSVTNSVKLSAHFVPSSSDVTLFVPTTTMNTMTGDVFSATIKDFDRTYLNFKSLTLQYRYEEDANWTELKKFVMKADETNKEVIPASGDIDVQIPMSTFSDGKYTFRVVSAATYGSGNSEKQVYSDEVVVIKDMKRPELLGSANPANGILSASDNINVRFNEDIRQGMLTRDRNFLIYGKLNDSKIDHNVAMKFTGGAEGAATQLPINLNGKDFTVDMWLNITGDGNLLTHGTKLNGFSVNVLTDGKLEFNMGGKKFTSVAPIVKDRWIYLTLNYAKSEAGGVLNALFANDAQETRLFENVNVPAYTGNGRLTVGAGLEGAMHDVALWNVAREVYESLSERDLGKSPVTPGLIGYWKMNEGHGTVAADAAEARGLQMVSDSWYLNNKNFALNLDGSHYLAIKTGAISPRSTESYAVEFWFRMDAAQQQPAALLQSGDKKVLVHTNAAGMLEMVVEGVAYATTVKPEADTWHHCLLNVTRGGSAILYLDGGNVLTLPDSYVPAFAGSEMVLGAKRTTEEHSYVCSEYLKGAVDEIRFWNGQFTGKYLNDNRYERVDTTFAAGLVGYYPMEKKTLDSGGQVKEDFNMDDASVNFKTGGAKVYAGNVEAQGAAVAAANAPALKVAVANKNLAYSFTASEREIYIDMNETADRLEGTVVNITLQGVQDLNGNYSAPITWSAYVRQNGLLWASDDVVLDAESGMGAAFSATIENKTGVAENWSLSNLPSWLTADVQDGILAPAAQQDIHFTISPAVAVGNHDEVIYLTGNNNISEALNFRLNVRAEAPDWSVDPTAFDYVATMVAQVYMDNKICENPETRVAAFINNECIGVGQVAYTASRDAYYLSMNIFGNENEVGDTINFKVWDASTGIIYTKVVINDAPDTYFVFGDNMVFGTFKNPTKLATTAEIEQVVALNQGWNWVSFYVNAENSALDALRASGNFVKVADQYDYSDLQGGQLHELTGDHLYKVKMAAPTEISVTGVEADNKQSVKNGWNWIGGAHMINLPLQDAFAAVATEDDLVKNLYGFAIYNGNVWEGSLKVIEPGKGYMYQSHTADPAAELIYPKSVSYGSNNRLLHVASAPVMEHFVGLTPATDQFNKNMTMVACVTRGGELIANAEVAVYVGADFRTAAVTDAQGRLFLTIPGKDGDHLRFVVFAEGQEYTISSASSVFTTDAHFGALNAPVSIDIDSVTGIELGTQMGTSEAVYFGLDGRAFGTERKDIKRTGVYILRQGNEAKKVLLK